VALDELLCDPRLLAAFVAHWEREALVSGVSAAGHGRPTLAIETYVRLMMLKHRHGWGYRSLVAEVSDRPAPLLSDRARGADVRGVDGAQADGALGEQTVNDMTRELIEAAVRERRFRARAVRIDSTVIEADVRYLTDAGWHRTA
jgi:IS5 family transposase